VGTVRVLCEMFVYEGRTRKKNCQLCAETIPLTTEPICQTMIIKMVRNMLLLRWLCSDVTAANAAALSEERPDVTFVSRNEYDYQCQELTTDVRQF
jgi:hypothetical protein